MGIFSRARDIISSNVNAMLDKAEDPEKLIKLIVREMEDTLIEIKASCAATMAAKRKTQRELDLLEAREAEWERRARLAIGKGRDDLAREAVIERRRYADRAAALRSELTQCDGLLEQYRADIAQLEEKLEKVLEKERLLVRRHVHASQKIRAQQEIRRFDTSDAMARFDNFEARIERMEAEGDLVNFGRRPSLEEAFARLEGNDEIDQELETLRASLAAPRA